MSTASVVTSHSPATGRQAVTLTSWSGSVSFSPDPVAGGQIEGDSGLTIGVDGVVTGADGTYTLHHINASGLIDVASYQIGVVDNTAPTLSALTATGTDPDTIDVSVSTDEGNGTLYVLASGNATETASAVKSGAQGIQAVAATGAQTISLTLATGSYYVHAMHEDAAANQSGVVSSAQVTLAELPQTASVVTSHVPPAGLTLVTFEEPIEHYIDQNWTSPIEATEQALFNAAEFTLDKHANWRAETEGAFSYWYINNAGAIFNPTFTVQNLPVVPDNNVVIDSVSQTRNTITISFTYAGTDAGGFEYSVDGSAWASTTSPLALANLTPETPYVIDIRPVSSVGVPGPATTRTVTTNAAVDTTPDSFSFTALTNVARSLPQTSNAITIRGVDAGVDVAVAVTGGTYSKSTDGGATWSDWTSAPGVVRLNHQLRVRHTSSNEYSSGGYNGVRETFLDVGTTVGVFRTTTLPDTTGPVIELTGGNMDWPQGTPWEEPGYRSIDAADGDISVSGTTVVGTVDENTLGPQEIQYVSTDRSNNTTVASRIVTVVVALPADQVAPVITLNGGNVQWPLGVPWVDPGYKAEDNVDGVITDRVSISATPDVNKPGSYDLIYSAPDLAGNIGYATRTVTVFAPTTYSFDHSAPDSRTYIAKRSGRLEMGAATFVMYPGELLDFDYDLTEWLVSQGNDTLVSGVSTVLEMADEIEVMATGRVLSTDRIKAWVQAGAAPKYGQANPVQLTVKTAAGRTAVFHFYLVVIDRMH